MLNLSRRVEKVTDKQHDEFNLDLNVGRKKSLTEHYTIMTHRLSNYTSHLILTGSVNYSLCSDVIMIFLHHTE